MTINQELYEHFSRMEKAQAVRIFDVLVFAPIMIHVGYKKKLSPELNTFFILAGIGTAIFNGINYVKIKKLKESIK